MHSAVCIVHFAQCFIKTEEEKEVHGVGQAVQMKGPRVVSGAYPKSFMSNLST
jgi:hypothetical protein